MVGRAVALEDRVAGERLDAQHAHVVLLTASKRLSAGRALVAAV